MESLTKMPHARPIITFGVPLIAIGGAVALFYLNPSEYSFFPKCTFYKATGYSCPGCGSTRALFNLTHGNVLEALRLNPGVIALLTISITDYSRYILATKRAEKFHSLFGNVKLIFSIIGMMLVYGILRNIPWTPFTNLTP